MKMNEHVSLFLWPSKLVPNLFPDGRICPQGNGSKRMGQMLIGTSMRTSVFGVLPMMDTVFGPGGEDTKIINSLHRCRNSQNTNHNGLR